MQARVPGQMHLAETAGADRRQDRERSPRGERRLEPGGGDSAPDAASRRRRWRATHEAAPGLRYRPRQTSADAQSMPVPSAILAARLCAYRRGFTFHLFRKSHERARDRHSRRIGRWLAEIDGQLLVGAAQLDAANDRLLFAGVELRRAPLRIDRTSPSRLRARAATPVVRLPVIEGRRQRPGRRRGAVRPGFGSSRPAQIRLKGPFSPGFEAPDLPKRIEERVLNKVVGIGRASRPAGQSAAGPALKRLQVTGEELIERRGVARIGAIEQLKGGVGVRRHRVRAGGRSGHPDFRQRGAILAELQKWCVGPAFARASARQAVRFDKGPAL